jgi:glycosyltransferase involved in cell wall biosynthesis
MKHIVIDARIRRASTGRPIDRFIEYLPKYDSKNKYTILIQPDDPIKSNAKNISFLTVPFKQFSLNPSQQVIFAKQIKSLKPDLVFFTMTAQAPLAYTGPSITFTHDLTMLRYARAGRYPEIVHKLRMIGYRRLFNQGNLRAKTIIVPSKFVKDDLSKYLPKVKDKIEVVYESSEPVLASKSKPLRGVNKPFIFHVGSPFPHKNVEGLVEAFSLLKLKFPNLQLVLAGKKEFYFNKIEEKIKSNKYRKDILITGFIGDEELKWLYQNAEAYVLPSLSEGFGLPGLEAMAHGCAVASSNATCLPEIYGNAAEYFDPYDVNDIASAVVKLMNDQNRKNELIKNGQTQLKKYSWEKMTKEIVAIIHQNL